MKDSARTLGFLFFVLVIITTLYFLIFYILFVEAEVCGDVEVSSNWLSGLLASCFG